MPARRLLVALATLPSGAARLAHAVTGACVVEVVRLEEVAS
jgi:hypothetical protein